MEIDVGQEAVLGDMKANGHRGGISLPQIEIDVTHTAVEREFAGID